MPFRSAKQKKACFATKGFGGKIDCKVWLAETKDKTLPKKSPKTSSSKKKR